MAQGMAPAGWYAEGPETQRYWDGRAWTDRVRQAPPVPPASPGYATPAPGYGAPMAPPWPAPGYGVVVAPKSPALALVASFFVPGLGQLINGEIGKGIGMLVGYAVAIVLVIVLIGFVAAPAIWIWSMVDAYQGAQRWNTGHGIIA